MEVEQTNFATHLIITVCTIIIFFYLKTRLLKFGQIRLIIIVSCVQVYTCRKI